MSWHCPSQKEAPNCHPPGSPESYSQILQLKFNFQVSILLEEKQVRGTGNPDGSGRCCGYSAGEGPLSLSKPLYPHSLDCSQEAVLLIRGEKEVGNRAAPW